MKNQSNNLRHTLEDLEDSRFNTAGYTSIEVITNNIHNKNTIHFKQELLVSDDNLQNTKAATSNFCNKYSKDHSRD